MSNDVVLLIGRILLSAIFIMSGLFKFVDIAGTAGYISSVGLPAGTALAWLAAIFETLVGLAILVGFQTKIAAWLLVAFCLFTGFVFHSGAINIPDFPEAANAMLSMFNQIMLMKNLALAGGLMVLTVSGPGALSVDAKRA